MRTHGYGREALIQVGRRHWRDYLPKKYKALKESGELEAELKAAAEMTVNEMQNWQKAGASLHEAWEAVRENYLILKAEPDYEPMPPNLAYEARAEWNALRRKIEEEGN